MNYLLYCGSAQARIRNVTPMDPKNANVMRLQRNVYIKQRNCEEMLKKLTLMFTLSVKKNKIFVGRKKEI